MDSRHPNDGTDASAADGGLVLDPPRESPPAVVPDASGTPARDAASADGGPACTARCEKARCPDLEACVELCAKQSAAIPKSCDAGVRALEACADTRGTWQCDRGEATVGGPCANEAVALVNCIVRAAADGGTGGDGGH